MKCVSSSACPIGIYTGENEISDGEKLFVCEREVFQKVASELVKPCACQALSWKISSVNQVTAYYYSMIKNYSFEYF